MKLYSSVFKQRLQAARIATLLGVAITIAACGSEEAAKPAAAAQAPTAVDVVTIAPCLLYTSDAADE